MRILSGIQPSDALHLENYFGMMKPVVELQEQGEAFYLIANKTENKLQTPSHHFQQRVRHLARRDGHADASVLERRDLRRRRAFAAADYRARMAHAASRRSSRARDESGDRLLTILFDPLGGFFFGAAAD